MQRKAISCHCFTEIGCSIEWILKAESFSSFSNAELKEKDPLASNLTSISDCEYSALSDFKISHSKSKSNAPTFIFMHLNPDSIFSFICFFIKDFLPIQIKPLIDKEPSPVVKLDFEKTKGFLLSKERNAVSRPNKIAG